MLQLQVGSNCGDFEEEARVESPTDVTVQQSLHVLCGNKSAKTMRLEGTYGRHKLYIMGIQEAPQLPEFHGGSKA